MFLDWTTVSFAWELSNCYNKYSGNKDNNRNAAKISYGVSNDKQLWKGNY